MSAPSLRDATTPSGLAVRTVYEPSDPALAGRLGPPGEYPFTRGIHPTMHRGRLWTMRQYAGFGSARETNRRFRFLLDQGQTGLSVAFDLPTQIGYDADHPLAAGEVGKVGVAIQTLRDLESLFEGIPLREVSVSMTINATASVILAMLVSLARRQGVPAEGIRGTVQNDILKEYAARGTFRFPVAPSLRLVTDLIEWCAEAAPSFHPISISGYHMREAGCTAVQEVGFTLANGIAYVAAARDRGLAVDRVGEQVSFFFNAHNHLFEEAAKFRAARRLWARTMREGFGASRPGALQMRFHAQTAGSMLAARQVDNNVVRVTVQALAAILGGTQSLHTNSRDEALSLPGESSARLALRTQQVLAHESGVADTADPLGGSAFVEALTDEIEAGAAALIEEVDRLGGAVRAIESGFVQREIHKSALRWQREVESGARVLVGVNRFEAEEPPPPIFRVGERAREEVLASLAAARNSRDGGRVRRALDALEKAAGAGSNLLPPILEAVEAYATVGEICARLERVFGRYRAPSAL
ncbi:MAG: methylmalonyl-CoA mutase family protein [Planctomycetes bacterium]|nr:methylmalonyl-CoA mutase family protein [Planctomycetota bacterium]